MHGSTKLKFNIAVIVKFPGLGRFSFRWWVWEHWRKDTDRVNMESHEGKPVQLTPRPPKNARGRTWERNRVSEARGRYNHKHCPLADSTIVRLINRGYVLYSPGTNHISTAKTSEFVLLQKRVIIFYSNNHIPVWVRTEYINADVGGTYSYHCDINS